MASANGDPQPAWRVAILELRIELEKKFRDEQEALDKKIEETMDGRLEDIEISLQELVRFLKAKPKNGSQERISAPGLVIGQKHALALLATMGTLIVLLLLGLDGPTIAEWLFKRIGP